MYETGVVEDLVPLGNLNLFGFHSKRWVDGATDGGQDLPFS
jgi:hypothetical protein